MDRRETLKTLMVGTVAGAAIGTSGCSPTAVEVNEATNGSGPGVYGRTPSEQKRDQSLFAEEYFNKAELTTVAILCDIILPATPTAGSATEAGVPEFVEFIVKDMPNHQLPIRGGLMWLDGESNRRFNKLFSACTNQEQLQIIDDIAYSDSKKKNQEMAYGVDFFKLMRNLTLTGYYTSKVGIKDLGYKGNVPNIWDGVPAEVLADHDVDYDPEWLAKCVDQSKREDIAEWDDQGNLLT